MEEGTAEKIFQFAENFTGRFAPTNPQKSREKKENGVSTLLTKFFFRDHRRIGGFKIGEVGIITFPPVAPGGKRKKKVSFLGNRLPCRTAVYYLLLVIKGAAKKPSAGHSTSLRL